MCIFLFKPGIGKSDGIVDNSLPACLSFMLFEQGQYCRYYFFENFVFDGCAYVWFVLCLCQEQICIFKRIMWLNDLSAAYVEDGLKFVFSPDITVVVDWAQSTN